VELRVEWALLPEGLARHVVVEVGADGQIVGVARDVSSAGGRFLPGLLLPGMPNLHSHGFQRAMAGAAEVAAGAEGSFWGWRSVMYRFVEQLTPADTAAITAFAYMEMLEAGYTAVAEFHYLHHKPGGAAFKPAHKMSVAVRGAAERAGIRQLLLPTLYQYGNFGGKPLGDAQRRFFHSTDDFVALFDALVSSESPLLKTGLALHSLRAVSNEALRAVAAVARRESLVRPVHIHVAEQTREVQDCLVAYGRRPVEHLLESGEMGRHWCLVHATHVTASELAGMAAQGVVLGLCPTTEANLGDGRFPLDEFLAQGGRFGIGSDSHVSLDPREELRLQEYTLRLWRESRVLTATAEQPHVGTALWQGAVAGGAQAFGFPAAGLAVGAPGDALLLNTDRAEFAAVTPQAWLDAWLFAPRAQAIDRVWVGGREMVTRGRHIARARIERAYKAAVKRLIAPA
jgi:formimidoylglutamate deiminase